MTGAMSCRQQVVSVDEAVEGREKAKLTGSCDPHKSNCHCVCCTRSQPIRLALLPPLSAAASRFHFRLIHCPAANIKCETCFTSDQVPTLNRLPC